MEHLKEKIKLHTEWLKGFFVLFVLDTTAITTLLVRHSYLESDYEYKLLISAIIIYIALIAVIFIINNRIKKFINLLKS